MEVTFINHSDEHIELTLYRTTRIIGAHSSEVIPVDYGRLTFSLNPYEKSYLMYFIKKAGLIRKKSFCTLTSYSTEIFRDSVIDLSTVSAKGAFADTYHKVVAKVDGFPVIPEGYRVVDEDEMRKEFADAKKHGNRTIFFFDVLDILKSGLIVLLLLLIPFALIWIFSSLEDAYTVCRNLFIPIFAVIIIFNRIFDRLKKKLWYYLKGKTLKKSTYKGTNSHFEEEYIREIF